MSVLKRSAQSISITVLALGLYSGCIKSKEIDKARQNIDAAIADIQNSPKGELDIQKMYEELDKLETTRYGRTALKRIEDNLWARENANGSVSQENVTGVLLKASNDANSKWAENSVESIGLGAAGGAATGVLIVAPLIGNLLYSLFSLSKGSGKGAG